MSLEFIVTYAGVPFVLDQGKVVRIHHPYMENDPATLALPPQKHQPLADMIDELNRIYPFVYLEDFTLPTDFPGRTLDCLARPPKIGPMPNPHMKIWDYYYPTGAQRWSVFRGLATSSMAQAMLSASQGKTANPFVMQQSPVSPDNPDNDVDIYTIQTELYMLPPRPLADHGAGFDGLYLITLVDERYYFQGTPVLLTIDQETDWDDLIDELTNTLGITLLTNPIVQPAYGRPEKDSQLWCRFEQAPALLDAVAANLGLTVVRLLSGSYELLNPTQSAARINTNRGDANSVVRTAGGDIFTSGTKLLVGDLTAAHNSVVPGILNITYPQYILNDDPVPHLVNQRYQVQRPSTWYEDSRDVYTVAVPILSGGPCASGLA